MHGVIFMSLLSLPVRPMHVPQAVHRYKENNLAYIIEFIFKYNFSFITYVYKKYCMLLVKY